MLADLLLWIRARSTPVGVLSGRVCTSYHTPLLFLSALFRFDLSTMRFPKFLRFLLPSKSRPFFDLLPDRIEQALSNVSLRSLVTRLRRRRHDSTFNSTSERPRRQIFVDVSVISENDAGTGIQRVVRSLAFELALRTLDEWDIRFVSASRHRPYRVIAWPERASGGDENEMRAEHGDIFVGLDYSLDAIRGNRRQLRRFRRDGGRLWFLVHDLLPLNRPDWFSRNTVIRYRSWLGILAGTADGFLCNSEQTRFELAEALAKEFGLAQGYDAAVLPMGYSIQGSAASPQAPKKEGVPPRIDITQPFVLMVGTVEPRKGHVDIIEAFDRLWDGGVEERLVLVGRKGWQVQALCERIVNHIEFGNKLFWFDDVDDLELSHFYEACNGVIIASYAEGFGLPLLEALGYAKPVLARDIPIFHTFAANGVHHFPANADHSTLARSIRAWVHGIRAGKIEIIAPRSSWSESASALISAVSRAATL